MQPYSTTHHKLNTLNNSNQNNSNQIDTVKTQVTVVESIVIKNGWSKEINFIFGNNEIVFSQVDDQFKAQIKFLALVDNSTANATITISGTHKYWIGNKLIITISGSISGGNPVKTLKLYV